jgi:DNA-nicking Smr family endonuclease
MGATKKRGGKDGRPLTPEEQSLWEAAMRDAKPLPGHRPSPADAGEKPEAPPARRPKPRSQAARPPRKAAPSPAPQPASLADLDKRSAQRLRRGQMPIEGRLDLHGLTQAEAHRTLDSFIAGAHAAGKRCVLVITGKGGGEKASDDEGFGWREPAGVLREQAPRWLSEPVNRARVVAWHPAQPKHGGAGALYVLLRRHRD